MQHLHPNKFEALLFKPLDDLSDDASLHAIRLDGNECAFLQIGHDSEREKQT